MGKFLSILLPVSLFSGCSLLFWVNPESFAETTAARCSDGVDNDGDDLTDCDDDGCAAVCSCGDGVVVNEECDDGNKLSGDGCSAECLHETGCGDGILDEGEACDDGSRCQDGTPCLSANDCVAGQSCQPRDGDGCSEVCTAELCGDGILNNNEACDNGADNSDSGTCTTRCALAFCGDGLVINGVEDCDDGNNIDTDACTNACKINIPLGCGNFIIDAGEECDDGNNASGDGCDSNCTSSRCGNGIKAGPEECDDGNTSNNDSCIADCIPAFCGDNFVFEGIEACDDGNANNTDGCLVGCVLPTCGDSFLLDLNSNGVVNDGDEECDDGGTAAGDGCGPTCLLEFCGDGIINNGQAVEIAPIGEVCDDGMQCDNGTPCLFAEDCPIGQACSARSGDGCTSGCGLESFTEVEPNEDGSPSPQSVALGGNDFNSTAVANALANTPRTNGVFHAAINPLGDEDVFAIINPRATPVVLSAKTLTSQLPVECAGVDTFMSLRSESGVVLAENNDFIGTCAGFVGVQIPANTTLFLHVLARGDTSIISSYLLEVITDAP